MFIRILEHVGSTKPEAIPTRKFKKMEANYRELITQANHLENRSLTMAGTFSNRQPVAGVIRLKEGCKIQPRPNCSFKTLSGQQASLAACESVSRDS